MLLHHLSNLFLNHSKQDKWLVLIKLLAVGGISGTLLISTLASAYKQKPLGSEDEALSNIDLMNKGQELYFKKYSKYAYSLATLNTVLVKKIPPETQYYQYKIAKRSGVATNQARPLSSRPNLKAVIGGIPVSFAPLYQMVCIAEQPRQGGPKGREILEPFVSSCPPGYKRYS
jgi:hypothetical protein